MNMICKYCKGLTTSFDLCNNCFIIFIKTHKRCCNKGFLRLCERYPLCTTWIKCIKCIHIHRCNKCI